MQWDSATIQAVRCACAGNAVSNARDDTSIRLLCDGVCWWYI